MYYQMFGRAMRPFEGQDAWLVDACRNLHVFGRLEDITVDFDIKGLPVIKGTNGKLLTGVPLKEQEIEMETQVFG
jgi:DNA repair protein RadD